MTLQQQKSVCIAALALTDFRNYSTLSLTLGNQHIVLTGPNGSGKTNLLESISCFSPGRGLRRSSLEEMARESGPGTWAVTVKLSIDEDISTIGTGLLMGNAGEKARKTRIDGTTEKSAEAFLDYVVILWLTPAMDGLFTGSGSDRRKFVDRFCLALNPRHGTRVNAFEKAMRNRNRMLEDGVKDASWLDAIEAQLADHGVAVAASRREIVSLLRGAIEEMYAEVSAFPKAGMVLEGLLEQDLEIFAAVDVEDRYRDRLRENRTKDKAAGRTLEGPHRTELHVRHVIKDMPASKCSTGEQKALLLGLVLAHARLVAGLTGQPPIMLLDEIAAHLDRTRREALFEVLNTLGCQAWLTGTDKEVFEKLGDRALYLSVDEGVVSTITQ